MKRKCIAEFLGTFAIVFFGCGAIASIGTMDGSRHLAVCSVFGLTVAVMIYALGHISSAHFNPAVTLALAWVGKFPWKQVGPYAASQTLGAVSASALHFVLLGKSAQGVAFGATIPAAEPLPTIAIEIVLTFFLMLVVISTATDHRVHRMVPGSAIGATVALGALFGGSLTGASMNPARSIGPALFAGAPAVSPLWIYLVGPCIGAIGAAMLYEYMRGVEVV